MSVINTAANAIGSGVRAFAGHTAQAAANANAVSKAAQTAQGNFNAGQASIANQLGTDRIAEMYAFNSAQAAMANNFTSEMWDKMAAFNHNEALLNRQWQEKMANTAYQRAVKDMVAAGLNPALAVTGGGIATGSPSGSAASVGSAQGVAASGSALNGIAASESSYSGQMEATGGMLGLLAAAINGIGTGMQALGNLGDFGREFGEALGQIFNLTDDKYDITGFNKFLSHLTPFGNIIDSYEGYKKYKNEWNKYGGSERLADFINRMKNNFKY